MKSQETIVVIPELVAKRCLGGTARPVSLSGDMRLSSCGTAMWQKLRCCGAAKQVGAVVAAGRRCAAGRCGAAGTGRSQALVGPCPVPVRLLEVAPWVLGLTVAKASRRL